MNPSTLTTINTLLPLRAMVITLQCTDTAKIAFFHQPALTAFLRFIAGSPEHYDQLIRIDAPESGRTRYHRGDHYRFVLIGLAGSEDLLDHLLNQLAKLPASAPKQDRVLPFRDNWKLVSVQDMFSGNTVHQLDELSWYDEAQLQDEATLWSAQSQFDLQWVSPASLLKHKKDRIDSQGNALKNEARYVRDLADLDAGLLFSRIYNLFADLLRRRGESPPPLEALPDSQIDDAHLFWLDVVYSGSNHQQKRMGGLSGRMTLTVPANLDPAWWVLLVLGQYLGIGQRSAFGWGRYVLLDGEGAQSYRRVFPASSLLLKAKDEENLSRAWRHVMSGRDIPEDIIAEGDSHSEDWLFDEDEVEARDLFPLESLAESLEKLFWGRYSAPDLRGYVIPKKNGGVRPLAVPPAFDRVLQRAVQQVLNESLEPLMSAQSHGYRPGRSRITASQAIQSAWREGYRWVYEGDIHDFFDSVSWRRVADRLNAIFFNDPLVAALMQWMQAAVVFKDERIERQDGLPQGSPLSPLLANLMLDDFDNDMEAAGFRLIRFADDFVVLCKNPEEAQRAEQTAQRSLEEHGLALHPDKSRIAEMDDGFHYLGYLFVNDMALDVSRNKSASDLSIKPVSPNSWLAQLGTREAERAQSQQSLTGIVERIHKQQAVQLGQRENSGTFVTITGAPAVVSTLSKQMNVYRQDQCLMRLPWNSIEAILLLGNHQITTQAMHAALDKDVPIHLANTSGHYKGCISHNRNSQHQSVWMQQILSFQDEQKALYCAKQVIAARLRHMKEVLRQRKKAASVPVIDKAIRTLNRVTSRQQLLGYEGSATREYYAKLAEILPENFNFTGRNRRPPRDPLNMLLSIGYTQLYALVESVLHVKGLLPWQGFYHQPRGKHAVLASDLMEPFRHFVERAALSMVLRGEITADDFSYTAAKACHMDNKARRKYLAYLLQSWEVQVTARGQSEPQSWLNHMQEQAQSLKNFVTKGEPFHAFRMR